MMSLRASGPGGKQKSRRVGPGLYLTNAIVAV